METLRVTSKLKRPKGQPLRGRFNGEDYIFPEGEPVTMSIEAAKHIFGIGEEDKVPALNKLGLLIPGKTDLAEAMEMLNSITFEQGRVVFDSDVDSALDEAQREAASKRTGGRRPHVDPAGEGEGGKPLSPVSTTGEKTAESALNGRS